MKTLKEIKVLSKKEEKALNELKTQLKKKIPHVEIILYGSKARGDSEISSDIDLLILVDENINRKLKEKISDIRYDVELKHDVVFGVILENKEFWNSPLADAMPFHRNVEKEGIIL